jgi:hypothetical protein
VAGSPERTSSCAIASAPPGSTTAPMTMYCPERSCTFTAAGRPR